MMTFSWHNINDFYKNNTLKYSPDGGKTWKTITFSKGWYSYLDLNNYIQNAMKKNRWFCKDA